MPLFDSDISWQVLRRIIKDWAGDTAQIAEVRPLDGGCINTTLCITTDQNDRAVLKISPHRVNREFEREAAHLKLIREIGIPAPKVYAQKTASLEDPHSWILMEFMDGVDLTEAKRQCSAAQFDALQQNLAEIVATLHDKRGDAYERVAHHEQKRFDDWPRFFHAIYDSIWHECEKASHLPVKSRKQIARIHEKLDSLLANSDPPRLVHWDIWSTNLLAKPDEKGDWKIAGLLDPNCKFAHAEAEIAYMELFHTCTPAFLKAYQKHYKLPEEYHRSRKWIYQLYPMIDHVVLFGEQYLKPLQTTLDQCTTFA
ncbi:MAG: fructosamine kinase family protein [Anaerolineae bacterium]|nr:fructosamine kinase family protein [Phycisphaerae bacterium]